MKTGIGLLVILGPCLAVVEAQTAGDFECYVRSAETRMEARKTFLLSDGQSGLVPANGPNPHKIAGGQLYDFVGDSVFIPGGTLERTLASAAGLRSPAAVLPRDHLGLQAPLPDRR